MKGALTGKRALVTCGSRGIGRAVVERLARAGAAVVFGLVEHGAVPLMVDVVKAGQAHCAVEDLWHGD